GRAAGRGRGPRRGAGDRARSGRAGSVVAGPGRRRRQHRHRGRVGDGRRRRAADPHFPRRSALTMQVWAIANQKGGVGKTTTTLCLARGLAKAGGRVLLVDLDPHASLTRAFDVPVNPPPSGTHDLFTGSGATLATLARR